ncbi:MAG: tRNA preQ1(34) S-adenosylmethionine ribosyltransferase-isomerase QueA [Alphaproteobacteria bacterium]|nr:tRNA preQ1(34) S-adenosylmethionine ribosyltransferase-isomerase QueA [Alphaproteobacteria bacterium]
MDFVSQQKNWRTSDFDFALSPKRIAAEPVTPRDHARLLHVRDAALGDHRVFDLPDLLQPNDLLVINDTKVIPARLYGLRGEVKVEILLHKRQNAHEWLTFARPAKRLRPGDEIVFADALRADVIGKTDDGEVLLSFPVSETELFALLHRHGHVPLPPYIKRPHGDTEEDRLNYQTVYAQREGAVAAPTAGLHFTPELLEKLKNKGIETATVTLHVGGGTFLPVKTERLADHVMHAEWGEITPAAAEKINAARHQERRIVAVGTTSLRILETAANKNGQIYPFSGETSIFITPGYRFKIVDALMTNFHLPKSTLFMLVSAFAGVETMREAYAHAIANAYRFYSYGDATLLEKSL